MSDGENQRRWAALRVDLHELARTLTALGSDCRAQPPATALPGIAPTA